MAVDQELIEGAKDLLYSDYLDINVPISKADSARMKAAGGEFKDWMKTKYQQVGDAFKGLSRGGGGKKNLVDQCANLSGGPGSAFPQREGVDVDEVVVEEEGRGDVARKPFSFEDFKKDVNGYAINPNIPRKDMVQFDNLLKEQIRSTTRHYNNLDSKGISDVPGGTKIMTAMFKGAKKALFDARLNKDTEKEQQVTNDVVSFMKQIGSVKQAQEVFFEEATSSVSKGHSKLGGGIYSAASNKENIRFMEQIYSGNSESSYVGGKLHFNVLNNEGDTILMPYDEIDKNVILKDYESEVAFLDYTEDVRSNAASGKQFNEAGAENMLRRFMSDGGSIKEFVLKDWVFDNKAGFNFKVWFENKFPQASLDFIHDPLEFNKQKENLQEAVVEYYVDILKNEHNIALGKSGGEITISNDALKAFTKQELQEISKKSQNLPD